MPVALSVFVILLVTAPGLVAEPPLALPTTIFTLDVEGERSTMKTSILCKRNSKGGFAVAR